MEHAQLFLPRVIVIQVDARLFTIHFGVASLDLGVESFDLVFGVSMDLGAPSLEPRGLGVVSFLELELGAFIPKHTVNTNTSIHTHKAHSSDSQFNQLMQVLHRT